MTLHVRVGRNDKVVLEELLGPVVAGARPIRPIPVDVVVTDAQVARAVPRIARTARMAGVPLVIDPLTPLLVSEQRTEDSWTELPYARPAAVELSAFGPQSAQDVLVHKVITYQRDQGATRLIPPYIYSPSPDSREHRINIDLMRTTAKYVKDADISTPIMPVLAVSLREYGVADSWSSGIDDLLDAVAALNAMSVAVSWSSSSASKASLDSLLLLLSASRHIAGRLPLVAWRGGLYGSALVAAGAIGYETGLGYLESVHYPRMASSRRPRPSRTGGGGSASVYVAAFGRSIPRSTAAAVLSDPKLAAALVCSDEFCCPNGIESMTANWRQHAARQRSRALQDLADMPSTSWRLNHVASTARRGADDARLANQVLSRAGLSESLPEKSLAALAQATDLVRSTVASRQVG